MRIVAVRAVVMLLLLGAALLGAGHHAANASATFGFTVSGTTGPFTVQQGQTLTLAVSAGPDSGPFAVDYCPDATCSVGYVLADGTLAAGEARTIPVIADFPAVPAGDPVSFAFRMVDAGTVLFAGPATVNRPPAVTLGGSVTLTVPENGSGTVTLPDTDADGDPLRYRFGPAFPSHYDHFTFNGGVNGGASITYYPQIGYYGPDQFQVSVSDSHGGSATITINVTVVPAPRRPVVRDGTLTTDEDTPASGQLTATDVNATGTMTYTATPPALGTLDLDPATGAYTYTPPANYNGPDRFAFMASNGMLTSLFAVVTITVNPVNDAPVATDQSVTTDEDMALAGQVTATDVDNDPLTYAAVDHPQHGTVTLDATSGAFTYTPQPNYAGPDDFAYTASDGELTSDTGTVTIIITPVPDAAALVTRNDRDDGERQR